MQYKWNKLKAQENIKKHSIDFADAVIALEDKNGLTIEDNDAYEQRFKTLDMGPLLKILFVWYMPNRIKTVFE